VAFGGLSRGSHEWKFEMSKARVVGTRGSWLLLGNEVRTAENKAIPPMHELLWRMARSCSPKGSNFLNAGTMVQTLLELFRGWHRTQRSLDFIRGSHNGVMTAATKAHGFRYFLNRSSTFSHLVDTALALGRTS
jgi:hypothetical protein